MKEIILIKNGELVLKGLNRNTFEDILIKNMKKALKELGNFKFTKSQSTIMVESENENCDLDEAVSVLKKVFGIAARKRGIKHIALLLYAVNHIPYVYRRKALFRFLFY